MQILILFKLFPSTMEEKLIINLVGFPIIYDVLQFAYRHLNKKKFRLSM